jgi:hypothetical protein
VNAALSDPREILLALARHAVSYVVVGGIAVQAHGGQRLTQDLDIAVPSDRENYTRLAAALVDIDARILGPESGDLWQLDSDHGLVDVIVLPAALGTFALWRERAHQVDLGDVAVPVAARADLIAMKRSSGRPQDLEDVDLLEGLPDD